MHDYPGHTVDTLPLLATKLFVPRTRSVVVRRNRLLERLESGKRRKLTLLIAPAGSGKTTLLTDWLSSGVESDLTSESAFAWISLDAGDNDPVRFWTYVLTGIRRAASDVGLSALEMLHAAETPPVESVLTTLINDIARHEEDVFLVLDDLHLVEETDVSAGLTFLLDNLPVNLHLIVASRADPPLPLAALRARGELNELRSRDLRFTVEEAGQFLSEVMGVDVSQEAVRNLEQRTEGWAAGLQLAALSMRDREDVDGFIASFSGDAGFVADFLVDEVLRRQPEAVRRFLLQTSILNRMSGPLCDAVTDGADGGRLLDELQRSNLFVVPLDEKRRWYRYHHLFSDLLQAHLEAEQPVLVPALHRRASAWFDRHGFPNEAIRHSIQAEDFTRAADLVECAWREMDRSFRSAAWLQMAERIPSEEVRRRPVMSMEIGWAYLDVGRIEEAAGPLETARTWLAEAEETRPADMVVADENEFAALPATLEAAEAYLAQARGQIEQAVAHAGRALELLPPDDVFYRGILSVIVGMARWTSGELDDSFNAFREGTARFREAGNTVGEFMGMWVQAEIRMAQGRLRDAERLYIRASDGMENRPGMVPIAAVNSRAGLADIACERFKLDDARTHLEIAESLLKRTGSSDANWRILAVRARIADIQGYTKSAVRLIDEAEGLRPIERLPYWRLLPARRARIFIRSGQLDEAEAWRRASEVSVEDAPTFLREFELLTLARLMIARNSSGAGASRAAEIDQLLERLLAEAESGGRVGSRIEILMLRALALQAEDEPEEAFEVFTGALELAEPEDFVDLFVREGEPIRDLLRQAAADGAGGAYTRGLLREMQDDLRDDMRGVTQDTVPANTPDNLRTGSSVAGSSLVESLTPRESEILRLVASGLKNRDIAEQLFISVATVKRHIANIYGKLEAGSRTEAVAIANRLRLL